MTDNIESILAERHKTHGSYSDHARVTQRLKEIVRGELIRRNGRDQAPLTAKQAESLDMILHKIGRIITGQSDLADHWDDIAGYAKLINTDV